MRLRFRWPFYWEKRREFGSVSLAEVRAHLEDGLLGRKMSPAENSVIFKDAFGPEERVL